MRILFLDPVGGLAGDMLCAALFDVGVDFDEWYALIRLINIPLPSMSIKTVQRGVFRAQYFSVENPAKNSEHSHHSHSHHEHSHSHRHDLQNDAIAHIGPQPEDWEDTHRSWRDIRTLILESSLPTSVQNNAIAIFSRLAQAEARMHGMDVEEVYFHEVGAIDSIVDIIGVCIGLHLLSVDAIYCSSVPISGGQVRSAHGIIPLPAPATMELLQGWKTHSGQYNHEQVTPTGAAILSALGEEQDFPAMRILGSGYGAGTRNPSNYANILRVCLGEMEVSQEEDADDTPSDIIEIQTTIDDMTGEAYPVLLEQLFSVGALDAFMQSVHMKKGRPGLLVTILCTRECFDSICETIFRYSSSFGLRWNHRSRVTMQRSYNVVQTDSGEATIKIGQWKNITKRSVEFEDARRIATDTNCSIFEAMTLILSSQGSV